MTKPKVKPSVKVVADTFTLADIYTKKLKAMQLKKGQIVLAELEAQSKENRNHYGVLLPELESIKAEFVRATNDAHHVNDAAAFMQALVTRNEAVKLARAEYLVKASTKNEEG